MRAAVSIGDFSRMTHLSVKTLRHYHEEKLLLPVEIDQATGYRYYARAQLPTAQVIRRFRALGMPVDEVRRILSTSDPSARGKLIAAHLERLEGQLKEIQEAVASLRALLENPATHVAVEHRAVRATPALAISERVQIKGFSEWWGAAFNEILAAVESLRLQTAGPSGGLYANELFEDGEGQATLFVPVHGTAQPLGRVCPFVVPAAELAVTVHVGSHADVDRTYAALGSHVTEHELGVEGPIREYYLMDRLNTSDATLWRTEIAWPIFQATAR